MVFCEPQPRHVDPEDKLAELNIRDRVLFNALDRYPGIVAGGDNPLSTYKQTKLVRLIFDLIDYEGLRSTYKTLEPSVIIDLTKDYHQALKSYPPQTEAARIERIKAFGDVHAWVHWSLNEKVNLGSILTIIPQRILMTISHKGDGLTKILMH